MYEVGISVFIVGVEIKMRFTEKDLTVVGDSQHVIGTIAFYQ
jgi:hypothetical protein